MARSPSPNDDERRKAALAAFPLHPLALACLLQLAGAEALAQAAASPARGGADKQLPAVVVSATRIETEADQVPAKVSTIDAKQIERRQAGDVKEMLAHEVGVSVRSQTHRSSAAFYNTGRGGNEGINIRGLEGNQVMLQIDGVRLPMVYSSGPVFAGRGDYIDVEAFKRVELLRGPSSASYGSDGLAGAVSFLTKDPSDLLPRGRSSQAAIKLGVSSVDNSRTLVPSYAQRGEGYEAMVLASLRRGHEVKTGGSNNAPNNTRTTANPQDVSSDYLLGKLAYKLDARQRLKLSLEHLGRQVDTEVYTLFGDPAYMSTTDVNSRERIRRTLVKLGYEFVDSSQPLFQRAEAQLYWQDARNRQLGDEARSNTTAWNRRSRDSLYGERSVGASAQFETYLTQQRLVWGLDASAALVHSLKDGANYLNGSLVSSGSSAFVVNKSFPDTDYRLFGAFVQDEITLGSVVVTPGLRLDRFELDPRKGDPLYTVNNKTEPAALAGQALSPKLGAVWTLSPALRVFGHYAQGFRAPTPSQLNGGVTNLTSATPYRSIGNADLKPESSRSFELGLRGRSDTWRYSLSVFKARYEDFIAANTDVSASTTVPLEPGMPANTRTFQSINLNGVHISGYELDAAWSFLPGWTLSASYAHAKGDTQTGSVRAPLETINPDKAALGLRYAPSTAWGTELTLTGMQRQRRNPSPAANVTPKGFVIGDIAAWYEIDRHWSLNAALNNIGDLKYMLWSDARGVPPNSAGLDAYTQPGRSLSVSVRYQF